MNLNLAGFVIALSIMAALAFVLIRAGRTKEREKQQRETLDAVDTANEVRRDVARDPDPRQRLRDKWTRPVPRDQSNSGE